jgi:hypothetical protein
MRRLLKSFLAFWSRQEGVSIDLPGISFEPSTLANRALAASVQDDFRHGIFPKATIVEPSRETSVRHAVACHGEIDRVPEGQQLWLAATCKGEQLFHPSGPVHVHGDSWFGTAWVGPRVSHSANGQVFGIALVTLSEVTASEWQDYLDDAHRTGAWTGLQPRDEIVLAYVDVTRVDTDMPA